MGTRWLVLVVASFIAGNAYAAVGRISLEALVRGADLIVIGHVQSIRLQTRKLDEVPGQKQEIEFATSGVAELTVDTVLKGRLVSRSVLIGFPVIEDSPEYKVGQEVIALLTKSEGKATYSTIGMLQGKYLIEKDIVKREGVSLDVFLRELRDLIASTDG